jgi:hypothetical protein
MFEQLEKMMINTPSVFVGPMLFGITMMRVMSDPFGMIEKKKAHEEAKIGFDAFRTINPFVANAFNKEWFKGLKGVQEQFKIDTDAMAILWQGTPFEQSAKEWNKVFGFNPA